MADLVASTNLARAAAQNTIITDSVKDRRRKDNPMGNYPTDEQLEKIKNWPILGIDHVDYKDLMAYVRDRSMLEKLKALPEQGSGDVDAVGADAER